MYTLVSTTSARQSGVVAQQRVRVWVVDDQPGFRRAAAATVESMPDFVMAGECDTGEAAVDRIATGAGDVVLMDIHMPGMGGIEATRQICSLRKDLTVILMSTYDVEDLPTAVADCGAASYLRKENLNPDLLRRLWRAGG